MRPAHNAGVSDAADFDRDLYRGMADDYDRFRVSYPTSMTDDLLDRAKPSGRGSLLDLACGTGQITFAVSDQFAEIWAVDQEPDMIDAVRAKAAAAGAGHVRAVVSAAESLSAPAQTFELIAIGNAFHRLGRDAVAERVFRWLEPGRCVALLWASSPWANDEDWQRALSAVIESWKSRMGVQGRVPAGWDRARRARPDTTVLAESGFEPVGTFCFPTPHGWTADALIGLVYSTSGLPRGVLADRASAFEADVRLELDSYATGGVLLETIDFAYELARRPK